MSANTSGTWHVEAGGARLINTRAHIISAGDGLGPVAYAASGKQDLIAAAPDLLAALLALVDEPQPLGIDRPPYKAALAVISKATAGGAA